MAPKVSVLIPLYNRREFAGACVGSVLCQNFGDFEILIRDDCSTDGVYEFIAGNFEDGRIKLYRNAKNLGEAATVDKLVSDAAGEYVTILHNDDLYLPDALANLYSVAEKFGADVVHSSNVLAGEVGGALRKIRLDARGSAEAEVISAEPLARFDEWFTGGIFRDAQYNFFRREFVQGGGIFSGMEGADPLIISLLWIMKARVLVRTPVVFYVRREGAASQSGARDLTAREFEAAIIRRLEIFRRLEEIISRVEFFADKPALRYKIKARIFGVYENLNFDAGESYGDERYAAFYDSLESTFRKYVGEDAVYVALLYHWAHATHFNQSKIQALLTNCLKIIDRNI